VKSINNLSSREPNTPISSLELLNFNRNAIMAKRKEKKNQYMEEKKKKRREF